MGQFLQVNGDYNIKAGEGARITLDTGPATAGGSVLVTGDLVVGGETVSIAATNLDIEDNIITLNVGEAGPGVTLVYSGIEIDRGDTTTINPQQNASLLYDESSDAWLIAHGTAPGPFNYDESNLRVRRILTNSITDDGDLTLIGSGTGVVKVSGTDNYENQVTQDDDIPNKKYVDDAIQNQPTFQIVAPGEDSRVIISDKDILSGPGSEAYLTSVTGYTSSGNSAVSFVVDGQLVTQFYDDKVLFGEPGLNGIEIDGPNYEIRTETSITTQDIYINTKDGKLRTNNVIQIDKRVSAPGYVADSTLIYSASSGIGESGVWYVNDNADTTKQSGELISKNKALVFSMIF